MSTLLLFLPLAIVIVAFQATIVDRFDIAGGRPDLILVSIILLTMLSGRKAAVIAAIIVAVIYDSISGIPLGVSIIPLLVVVYLAGIGDKSLFGARLGWPVFVAVVATLVAGAITMAELSLLGFQIQWTEALLRVLIPTAILNAILIALLHLPVEYMRSRRAFSTD